MYTRDSAGENYTWNFTDIYADPSELDTDLAYCQEKAQEIASFAGKLNESADRVADLMETLTKTLEKLEKCSCYAYLQYSVDGANADAQMMMAKVQNVSVVLMSSMAFLEPEILSLPREQLDAYLTDPRLATHRHYFMDVVRAASHTLDAKGEEILSRVQKITGTPSDVYKMFTNVEMEIPTITDEEGNTVKLTQGNFGVYRESSNRRVREEACNTMFGTYKKYNNTFAALYGGSVKKDNMMAQLRSYESACDAALFAGNVPVSVYDNLIQSVRAALPSMEKYLRLRKAALGLEEIDVYDLYCPMVKEAAYTVPYEEACRMVLGAMAPLGQDYGQVLQRAFDNRWVDVYENPGKTSGAYSMGVYGVHPFVLLNYTDTLDDAFTLAHEMGHAMHSWYSDTTQDFANHDYKIMVAEVASTVNEVLLTKYLLARETEPARRAYILNHFLEGFRTTVFRQTLFAEFERTVHEKEQAGVPLTAEGLNKIYGALEETYYQGAKMQENITAEWSYIPHFYRPFYVYQYATGFCSAVAIATRILETGDASGYLRFLSTGGSDYPLEELKIAGIDLTSPTVVEDAMKIFDQTIEELAEALGIQL